MSSSIPIEIFGCFRNLWVFVGGEADHSSKCFPHSWGSKVQFAPQKQLPFGKAIGVRSLWEETLIFCKLTQFQPIFYKKYEWCLLVASSPQVKNLKRIKIHLSEFQVCRNQVLRPQKPPKHGFEIWQKWGYDFSWATEKKPLTFRYTGCLIGIGILVMVYYSPHMTGQYNPLYIP